MNMACWNTKIEKLQNGKIYIKSGDRSNSYYGKFWVAKINGIDQKFGFSRTFINDKDGALIDGDGIYEIYRNCTWAKRPENYFINVENGEYEMITKEDVLGMF